jgi:hypothetical protein
VETSTDNSNFEFAGRVYPHPTDTETADYTFTDNLPVRKSKYVYYRLKITSVAGKVTYSKILSIPITQSTSPQINITPNPVRDVMQVSIYSPAARNFQLGIFDYTGRQLKTMNSSVQAGSSMLSLSGFENWPNGAYVVKIIMGNEIFSERILITSK